MAADIHIIDVPSLELLGQLIDSVVKAGKGKKATRKPRTPAEPADPTKPAPTPSTAPKRTKKDTTPPPAVIPEDVNFEKIHSEAAKIASTPVSVLAAQNARADDSSVDETPLGPDDDTPPPPAE